MIENKLNNRVVRQPMSNLGVFSHKRVLRNAVDWFDESFREFTDVLEEVALARLALIIYLVVVHCGIIYWVLATPPSHDFLTNP